MVCLLSCVARAWACIKIRTCRHPPYRSCVEQKGSRFVGVRSGGMLRSVMTVPAPSVGRIDCRPQRAPRCQLLVDSTPHLRTEMVRLSSLLRSSDCKQDQSTKSTGQLALRSNCFKPVYVSPARGLVKSTLSPTNAGMATPEHATSLPERRLDLTTAASAWVIAVTTTGPG